MKTEMLHLSMWHTLIFSATTALFIGLTLATLWRLQWVRRLPTLESPKGSDATAFLSEARVRVSVVIAARDEEARIETTIRHLLAQRGIEAEFIVVDDRSTDRTAEILRRLASEDARVKLARVDGLPDGWIGKCHACHVGANAAAGEWLLFTDADCWLKPDVIARALQAAERDGADHVTLTPGIATESVAVRAWYLTFLVSLMSWIAGVNRDRPKAHVGIGAFNFVRASAYRECGGYEALRLTVVDDVKLGLLLSRAGKRTRAFLGGGDVECHWGTTLREMVRVMEKNYFAVIDYRLGLALAAGTAATLIFCLLLFGLFSGSAAGLIAAASPLCGIVPAALLARRLGWSWRVAIGAPFMFPVFMYAFLNSTVTTLRQGGIRWRDTFYSLKALRAGTVR